MIQQTEVERCTNLPRDAPKRVFASFLALARSAQEWADSGCRPGRNIIDLVREQGVEDVRPTESASVRQSPQMLRQRTLSVDGQTVTTLMHITLSDFQVRYIDVARWHLV